MFVSPSRGPNHGRRGLSHPTGRGRGAHPATSERVSFVHLHTHTVFSFGDGACRIDELVAEAARLEMPALAVTDHEGLYGAVRFYQACEAAGVKPIAGVELTVEPVADAGRRTDAASRVGGRQPADRRPSPRGLPGAGRRLAGAEGGGGVDGGSCRVGAPEGRPYPPGRHGAQRPPETPPPPGAPATPPGAALGDDGRIRHLKAAATMPPAAARAAGGHHLVLLAKDYAGWSDLCRIISAAHLEHPGEPPLARLETLAAHGGHIVALSGCRRGEVWSRLLAGDPQGARRAASVYRELFGRDFHVELQHELLPDSTKWLRALHLLARELRLPTVATNDVHYTHQHDAPLHDVLAAEAASQPLPNPLGRKNAELYLKSAAQMRRLFQRYPDAVAGAARIAERCHLDLGLGRLLFPAYPLPPDETAFSLLWKHCFAGAAERYGVLTPEVTSRLERELRVIEELGFAEYFLAVRDIVEFARGRGILYSGRGSAGNSIVSYVLRVTDADPIAHEL
ncbi:MAG: PHP domain-containing protein, partial [Thermoleophilia bacterium]|nr:PHP domain-containing protein [Thermoleophilia bacterium]